MMNTKVGFVQYFTKCHCSLIPLKDDHDNTFQKFQNIVAIKWFLPSSKTNLIAIYIYGMQYTTNSGNALKKLKEIISH